VLASHLMVPGNVLATTGSTGSNLKFLAICPAKADRHLQADE
jgi:hypothetical protein